MFEAKISFQFSLPSPGSCLCYSDKKKPLFEAKRPNATQSPPPPFSGAAYRHAKHIIVHSYRLCENSIRASTLSIIICLAPTSLLSTSYFQHNLQALCHPGLILFVLDMYVLRLLFEFGYLPVGLLHFLLLLHLLLHSLFHYAANYAC